MMCFLDLVKQTLQTNQRSLLVHRMENLGKITRILVVLLILMMIIFSTSLIGGMATLLGGYGIKKMIGIMKAEKQCMHLIYMVKKEHMIFE